MEEENVHYKFGAEVKKLIEEGLTTEQAVRISMSMFPEAVLHFLISFPNGEELTITAEDLQKQT